MGKGKFDAGAILRYGRYFPKNYDTYGTIAPAISALGGKLIDELLMRNQEEFESVLITKQNEKDATWAPLLKPSEQILSFKNMTSTQIFNLWKALDGSHHHAYSTAYYKEVERRIKFTWLRRLSPNEEKHLRHHYQAKQENSLPCKVYCDFISSPNTKIGEMFYTYIPTSNDFIVADRISIEGVTRMNPKQFIMRIKEELILS